MKVSQLSLKNFRGIKETALEFDGHALMIGGNNIGKSTICEALELVLGSDRQPIVEEFDFYNAEYLDVLEDPIEIQIEVLLTEVTPSIEKACAPYLERWDPKTRRVLSKGEVDAVDGEGLVWCLRLLTIGRYDVDEDEFEVFTYYKRAYNPDDRDVGRVPRPIKRMFGFLYLRALRTGTRALSLEKGSLLDVILRIQSLRTGIWENVRRRLESLEPPIQDGATKLTPVLKTIEARLAEYIPIAKPGEATKLYVSQLTREHLRKTLSFFIAVTGDQKSVPFQKVGTGTLNTLVLALLSFIAELKEENVIFAMEEPEIALPPHTQRRIADYLQKKTTQCFVTTHSPYVIEAFNPDRISILSRSDTGVVVSKHVTLDKGVKTKTYNHHIRKGFAEAMLGRGVIVAEGITEQLALKAVSDKMEAADESKYPLDLSGVTIVTPDGDGAIAEFGRFFVSLDLPTFAFHDKKTRSKPEQDALLAAGFKYQEEIPYEGMEELLGAEVPVGIQWTFLANIRDTADGKKYGIPAAKPADADIRKLAVQVLKSGKGFGRSASLIEDCEVAALPATIVKFLNKIYEQFPKPKEPEVVDLKPEELDEVVEDASPAPKPAPAKKPIRKKDS